MPRPQKKELVHPVLQEEDRRPEEVDERVECSIESAEQQYFREVGKSFCQVVPRPLEAAVQLLVGPGARREVVPIQNRHEVQVP